MMPQFFVRKDTTSEMLFQEVVSAIFLKNRELKICGFATKNDKL